MIFFSICFVIFIWCTIFSIIHLLYDFLIYGGNFDEFDSKVLLKDAKLTGISFACVAVAAHFIL